jgi:hypothetical protein
MYELVLTLHSWLRWIALVAGVLATLFAFTLRPGGGDARADRWGLVLVIALDLQLLLGFLLYLVVNPTTAAIFENFGAAMRNPVARFWAVEHASLMLLAIAAAHVGRVLGRSARTPGSARVRLIFCFGLATIAMLAAIPWPGMSAGRPLFRGF